MVSYGRPALPLSRALLVTCPPSRTSSYFPFLAFVLFGSKRQSCFILRLSLFTRHRPTKRTIRRIIFINDVISDSIRHTCFLLANLELVTVVFLFCIYLCGTSPPFASCLLNQCKMWKCSCDLMLDVFAFH